MIDHKSSPLRITLLALILVAFVSVLFKVLLFPNKKEDHKKTASSFVFPETINLPNWQLIKKTPIQTKIKESILNNGKEYLYSQNNRQLDIEAYYEPYTDGNVNRLLNIYKQIKPGVVALNVRQKDGVGNYAVFVYQKQAHLTACVNPQGNSTVTEQAYIQNKYTHTLNIQRTLFWILGQEDIADSRCLWTILSIPLKSNDSQSIPLEQAYETLETAWFDWYDWWKAKLPSS